jgi:hypothetical protein
MQPEQTRYRERSPWPGFVNATLWTVVVLSCYPILAGWDHDLPPALRWPLAGAIVVFSGALTVVVGGLTVLVQETRLVLHLGRIPLVKRVVPFSDIVDLRSVEYRPLRDFGGWGVRAFGRRKAWTARGNRAVALRLSDDRELLVGSDHPKRLEERIRTLAGGRLDAPG